MRILSIALILITASLAGCADNDDASGADVDAANVDVSAGGASASAGGESASASAGGANATAAGGAAGASAGDDAEDAAPVSREVAVAESGALPGGAEVCQMGASGGSCTGSGGVRDGFEIELGGGVATAYELTLTWTAATPATQTLSMSVWACSEDDCEFVHASGTSPLIVTGMGAWSSLDVGVSAQPHGAGPASVYAASPQEFTVDGLVTVVGP